MTWLKSIWATSWENLFMQYASNKDEDQPVHPRSLISALVVHCLDSISSFYIWNFKPLASFCSCAGRFESYLVANPEDRFSHDKAHTVELTSVKLLGEAAHRRTVVSGHVFMISFVFSSTLTTLSLLIPSKRGTNLFLPLTFS